MHKDEFLKLDGKFCSIRSQESVKLLVVQGIMSTVNHEMEHLDPTNKNYSVLEKIYGSLFHLLKLLENSDLELRDFHNSYIFDHMDYEE